MRVCSNRALFGFLAKSIAIIATFVGIAMLPRGMSVCVAGEFAPIPAHLGGKGPLEEPNTESETRLLEAESVPIAGLLIQQLEAIHNSCVDAVQPLRYWAEQTKRHVDEIIFSLGRNDLQDAEAQRVRLIHLTIQLAEFRKSWNPGPISQNDGPSKKEDYVPSSTALEELQLGLERWILLWERSILALASDTYPLGKLFSKDVGDILRLLERTQAAQDFFLGERRTLAKGLYVGELWSRHLGAAAFLDDLKTCQKVIDQPNRRVSVVVSAVPIPMLGSFSDRANAILAKLDESTLNGDQKKFLAAPAVVAWKEELRTWASDTVSPLELLFAVDAYETTNGTSDMAELHQLTARLLVSRSSAFRQLGRLTAELYGGPNIKVYISRILLNRLLPVSEPEEESFRDVILERPVFGQRRVEKEIEFNLIPADNQLLLSLDVKGSVQTTSRTSAFATTLFSSGRADYTARRQIELTTNGFQLSPSQVDVKNNRVLLNNIRTEFDRVPIVSGVFREIVLGQYESRRSEARAEAARKIATQTKTRIDTETTGKFDEINDQFRGGVLDTLRQLGLSLEQQHAKTESDWLLGSWRMTGDGVLSGSTPAPTTQAGSFADLKIHESAINALIGKLDIGGREMSAGEFRREIAAKFLKPEFVDDEVDDDDVAIAFASKNPVAVRFVNGRVEIVVSIESLVVQRQTFRDFKGTVTYRPAETPDGKLILEREGVVSFDNVSTQLRTQVVLRAVFGKIFPVGRPLVLSPQIFETDVRFADLKLGLCQIEKGWFSIALIAKE